ncbi:P1 family peptidase [Sphingosinicella soli]|uniref:D-aminopeptidase n=1 Tax=Sphingosinicella soli TaxID=333708 RepID=A0A7W7B358_9SPHN|nr:D-aminopeptidase [Sphingosinicella soli]
MSDQKGRARDFGVCFQGAPGPFNAVTDVPGIKIGHHQLVAGEDVRTGVTAIVIDAPDAASGVPAALFSFNGTGEMTGSHLIEEIGVLFGPVLTTGTLNVGAARDGALQWARRHVTDADRRFSRILPVVAETFDGRLHDAWGLHLKPEHALAALEAARGGAVEEGAVGGGTGMIAFGFKGGIGTASRLVRFGEGTFSVGVLAQCNYGRREELTICGVPVGRLIADLKPEGIDAGDTPESASLIVIVATDAPLDAVGLKRLARRAALGMGRTGVTGDAGSGDIFLAISTAHRVTLGGETLNAMAVVPPLSLDPFSEATVQAVEEALINALFAGETMRGQNGALVYGLPRERAAQLIASGGR